MPKQCLRGTESKLGGGCWERRWGEETHMATLIHERFVQVLLRVGWGQHECAWLR